METTAMRKLIAPIMTAVLCLGIIGPVEGAKPKTIWEDVAGDADVGQGLGASIPGGFDLAEGTIAKNKKNLEFTVTHHDMPPTGSAPEFARFLWSFTVNGKPFRITAKSVDIGKPDVAAGQTTERVGRVDVQGHFRLEGECVTEPGVGVSFVNCPPLEYLDGSFDPASMSFTAIVPLKAIKAKVGSVIGPGPDVICTICWVSHYAERSLDASIIDAAAATKSYKVPKK